MMPNFLVRDDELLMIADEIARSVARVEHAEVAAGILDRLEEFGLGGRAAETVDKQAHAHASPGSFDQSVANAAARIIAVENVEDQPKALLRPVDDPQQLFEPGDAALDQLEPVAFDRRADRAVARSVSVFGWSAMPPAVPGAG